MALRALIVEDARQMAERIAEILTAAGVEVVATVDTEDGGLLALDRNKIDLAVIDLQLSQGTGFHVLRTLKAKGRPPSFAIVLTNHAVPALKVAAFEAGANYFLDKQKDFDALPRIIAVHVAEATA